MNNFSHMLGGAAHVASEVPESGLTAEMNPIASDLGNEAEKAAKQQDREALARVIASANSQISEANKILRKAGKPEISHISSEAAYDQYANLAQVAQDVSSAVQAANAAEGEALVETVGSDLVDAAVAVGTGAIGAGKGGFAGLLEKYGLKAGAYNIEGGKNVSLDAVAAGLPKSDAFLNTLQQELLAKDHEQNPGLPRRLPGQGDIS